MKNETMREIMVDTIANAISEFNPTVADMFRARPFQRMALAQAFAGGFKSASHPVAVCVLEQAEELLKMEY